MKRLRFLVSLPFGDNGYQCEQARLVSATAARLGVDASVIYANGDAITQSQQLLGAIQSGPESRPDGIVFEPMSGTGLPRVTAAATAANIPVGIVSCEVDFLDSLRQGSKTPVLVLTKDQTEIGRLQGKQFNALLPHGGSILYLQGPSTSYATKARSEGMYETKAANIRITALRCHWTEESGYQAVVSLLRSPTARMLNIDVVGCQNDYLAVGARRAFQELKYSPDGAKWSRMLYTGVDGISTEGQAWVREGKIAATILSPPDAWHAMEMLVESIRTKTAPPERTVVPPLSYPSMDSVAAKRIEPSAQRSVVAS